MAVVGCVNEQENILVHSIAAGIFFGGYDLFMVLRTIAHFLPAPPSSETERRRPSKGARVVLALLALASTAATVARFCPHARAAAARYINNDSIGNDGNLGLVILPVLEWVNAIAICGYMYVSVCLLGDRAKNCGVALLYQAPPTAAVTTQLQVPLMAGAFDEDEDAEADSGGGIVLLDAATGLTYC